MQNYNSKYLSYLMGCEKVANEELRGIGVEIVDTTKSGHRKLIISSTDLEKYKNLVREKLENGFWNEMIGEKEIVFIFKLPDGDLKEYVLSPETEKEVDRLCAELNNELPDKTANVYKYISENDFYHDFMTGHYRAMIDR